MDGGIKFDVSANTARFEADMGRVSNSAATAAEQIRQAFRGLSTLLAGGAILGGLKTIMDDFDQVAKVATRFGASAEEIQRVSVAADLAGTSIDTVARVLTKMSVAASNATAGNDAMAQSFAKAGINAEQFKNSGLDEQLLMLSEAFNKARGSADATNQIIELMGTRAASQMIPLIDNTAALNAEMERVSVASDDVVRKIEAANDRITRFGNEMKVAFVGVLQVFIEMNERMGSIIAQGDGLLRLTDGLARALRGNFLPLFEVLATSRTIAEMEEIELRARAIAQLTNEGLITDDDAQNAALIAERMEEIRNSLEGSKTITGAINDDIEEGNALEKQKTSELERQQLALQSQEASRQKALRLLERETALIQARNRGDKVAEEDILERSDFESALERGGSFEAASNFSAARARERQNKVGAFGNASAGTSAALENRPPTDNERIAGLRGDFRAKQAEQRAAALQERNMFRSAVAAENRAQRRRDRAMESARLRDTFEETYGASNFGEAFREYQKETPFGQRLTEDQFKKFHEDMAKTPEQRAREEAQRQKRGGTAGEQQKDPAAAMTDILNLLKKHVPNIDEKLPQHALA